MMMCRASVSRGAWSGWQLRLLNLKVSGDPGPIQTHSAVTSFSSPQGFICLLCHHCGYGSYYVTVGWDSRAACAELRWSIAVSFCYWRPGGFDCERFYYSTRKKMHNAQLTSVGL
eukprot:766408-Hanusia_phi.AAC.8